MAGFSSCSGIAYTRFTAGAHLPVTYPCFTQYSTSWRLHVRLSSLSFAAIARVEPSSFLSSFSTPVMSDLGPVAARNIARIPCAANIPCADGQKILAYSRGVGSRKTSVSGAERAIGARIREARERLDLSIQDLALAFGKKRQAVQFWEKGTHFPKLAEFSQFCQLLRTDANWILGMQAMRSLSKDEIVSASLQIKAMAQAAKGESRGRGRATQERLHRRQVSASGVRR